MSRAGRRGVLVAVLLILVIGVAVAAYAMVGGGVTVPDVTGMTQDEAAQALEAAGLALGEVGRVADPDVPSGLVVGQDPAAGAEADEGSVVALMVSSGPGTAAVPDVVGMTRAEAQSALAEAGFVPASAMQYDLTAPAGQVVEQLPAGGKEAVTGSEVGLLVSRGRPVVEVSVPDVTGMERDEATASLADAGLVAVPVEAYSDDVPEGDVAGQEPAAGDRVAPLTEVLVTVSLGPGAAAVVVPDVVGMTQAKATDELDAAGLAVTAAHAWSAVVDDGLVIAQAPGPGDEAEEGGDAGILVSLGPPPSPTPSPSPGEPGGGSPSAEPSAAPPASPAPTPSPGPDPPEEPPELTATVPDVVGMDAAEAERELEALGLRPYPLEAPSAETAAGAVIAQLPLPGEQVPKTYPVLLLVSTGADVEVVPL